MLAEPRTARRHRRWPSPAALLWPLALITWGLSAALPFAAVSTVLHVAYLAMLARAYLVEESERRYR